MTGSRSVTGNVQRAWFFFLLVGGAHPDNLDALLISRATSTIGNFYLPFLLAFLTPRHVTHRRARARTHNPSTRAFCYMKVRLLVRAPSKRSFLYAFRNGGRNRLADLSSGGDARSFPHSCAVWTPSSTLMEMPGMRACVRKVFEVGAHQPSRPSFYSSNCRTLSSGGGVRARRLPPLMHTYKWLDGIFINMPVGHLIVRYCKATLSKQDDDDDDDDDIETPT